MVPTGRKPEAMGELAAVLGELERFQALVEQTSDWLWELELNGRFLYSSPKVAELLGYQPEEVVGRHVYALMRPPEARRAEALLGRILAGQEPFQALELTFGHRDGHELVLETSGVPFADEGGKVCGYRGISRDVTGRVRAEEQQRLSDAVVRAAAEGILVAGPDGRVVDVNPAFLSMTGFVEAQVLGHAPAMLELAAEGGRHSGLWDVLGAGLRWAGEGTGRSSTGASFPVWLSLSKVRDETGAVTGYVALVSDMTERRAAEETIRFQATHDALTNLANRAHFLSTLQAALAVARRDRHQVAVLFIDLDQFKQVNDRAGHGTGDLVLAAAARRLEGCVRRGDLVARFGGDEFTVCVSGPGVRGVAERIAATIAERMAQPFNFAGEELRLGASVGLALFPSDGDGVDALVGLADRAMFTAKARGGNQVVSVARQLLLERAPGAHPGARPKPS